MGDSAKATLSRADRPDRAVLQEVSTALRQVVGTQGRADLVQRLDETAWRLARTEQLVCVVGEFKTGKSALINALLGRMVCPVDDDLATAAVTVVRHGDRLSVTVRRRSDQGVVTEAVDPADVAAWVVEHEDAERRRDVVLVEIDVPHPLLEGGIAFVDTPGVGGLNSAHALATLAFLPSADALVFVTDASAGLTSTELEFLSRAVTAGPPVLLVVTKTDMYPEWRRIVALDEDLLRMADMDVEVNPVSSVLSALARDGDRTLADASGIQPFLEAVLRSLRAEGGQHALSTAAAEIGLVIEQAREPLRTELAALERPERTGEIAARLQAVRDRLAVLAGADAHWSRRLDDGFESLRTQVTFTFQSRMREYLREAQAEVQQVDPARSWPDLSGRIQAEVAVIVRDAFVEATDGAGRIGATISALIADEEAATGPLGGQTVRFDVVTLWGTSPAFTAPSGKGTLGQVGQYAGATLFAASLGTVGLEMLGLLGTLLGAAFVGPAVVGVALARGGKQILDGRQHELADRRRDACAFLTRFFDDVRFEVDGRLEALVGDLQRQMRSQFVDRICQLRRTSEAGVEALERVMEQDRDERPARIRSLFDEIAELDALDQRVEGRMSAPTEGGPTA